MNFKNTTFFAALSLLLASISVLGAEAKILKVLPHYLDKEGKHSIYPSLFERDAYQYYLRRNPEKCYGIQFDVQWKALKPDGLKLKIEMRGSKDNAARVFTIETPLKKETFFGHWMRVKVDGEQFKELGMLLAWRATLWDGDKLLSEQKSFLW
ncbi:MAG: hypothetical protein ACP5MG_14280 [Verrucomicrobiia bacterium]|jgi:hypothetical protein